MKRLILTVGKLSICFFLFFLAIFFTSDFVFRYQLEYNEMGRHFDEEDAVVYHEQAVLFYGFFSLISFIALILIGRWTIKTIGTKVV